MASVFYNDNFEPNEVEQMIAELELELGELEEKLACLIAAKEFEVGELEEDISYQTDTSLLENEKEELMFKYLPQLDMCKEELMNLSKMYHYALTFGPELQYDIENRLIKSKQAYDELKQEFNSKLNEINKKIDWYSSEEFYNKLYNDKIYPVIEQYDREIALVEKRISDIKNQIYYLKSEEDYELPDFLRNNYEDYYVDYDDWVVEDTFDEEDSYNPWRDITPFDAFDEDPDDWGGDFDAMLSYYGYGD